VTLADLRGMVLITPNPATLCLTLKSREALRAAHVRVRVETEQSLGALRTVVEELLATSGDVDARVEIDVAGQPGLPLKVQRFRWPELRASFGRVRAGYPTGGAQAVARMLDDPRHEYALTPDAAAQGTTWTFPPQLRGTCLAYLRDGPDVVSRPTRVSAVEPSPPCGPESIKAAVRLVDHAERQAALVAVFERMATNGEGSQHDRRWVAATVSGLNGLPATTLDALKELAKAPEALAHLLVFADSEGERSAIFGLEHQLPFLWLALPVNAWRHAFRSRYERVMAALAVALPDADLPTFALSDLRQQGEAILAREPGLEAAFSLAGLPGTSHQQAAAGAAVPLAALAGAHIRASDDRDEFASGDADRFRTRLAANGLAIPPELQRFDLPSHGGLLAPCMLAASAAVRLRLDAEDLLALRRWLRDDPDYVSRAYGLILPRYFR
jgi:hypothetical protein